MCVYTVCSDGVLYVFLLVNKFVYSGATRYESIYTHELSLSLTGIIMQHQEHHIMFMDFCEDRHCLLEGDVSVSDPFSAIQSHFDSCIQTFDC